VRIGELARRAEVSVQALRYYERRRSLRKPRRTRSGYRTYTDVPDEEGASPRFSRGSDRCLDEVAEIGERKLKSLDEDRKCGRLNNPFLAFPA
jgi:DNA-binding transcriptional MerR regulator